MRKKETLMRFEDITILYQYLYLSESHYITIYNEMCKLEIRMNDKGYFFAKNLNFPDLPDLNYTEMMTVPNLFGITNQLKKTPPEKYTESFASRWEEIKALTTTNLSLNEV